jgi:hypothetical protein
MQEVHELGLLTQVLQFQLQGSVVHPLPKYPSLYTKQTVSVHTQQLLIQHARQILPTILNPLLHFKHAVAMQDQQFG